MEGRESTLFQSGEEDRFTCRILQSMKAWMTGDILQSAFQKLTDSIARQDGRSVLLLLDNAGCHSHDMEFQQYQNCFFACKHNISVSTT